jgi:glutamate synthase domain-containing protein 2/glutamate synthase domain-containing protein 3
MHFATLIGFGASGINPYLAYETIGMLKINGELPEDMTMEQATENYITAIKKGLLKIMSKMGISTIRSYRGAQIFEAVGLNSSFIEEYFPKIPSPVEGVGLDEIARETLERHALAFENKDHEEDILSSGGDYQFRHNEEKHLFSPEAVVALHKAVRNEDYDTFKVYSGLVNDTAKNLCTLRGLFTFKKGSPVPVEEVEPVESIVKRFVSSAMSFGSISKEAHETMAIAMNSLDAANNSGEGGEDEKRFVTGENGVEKNSRIKQVASGRFGVTSNYLVNCREIQIKIAQGAKPGEGGQLPGHKVDRTIAKIRYSTPGVMLISPPPHHDIYSIEDLAQLIYDLKNANPAAKVSVKLVSRNGVGTVAAGVAKGKADMVLISGYDGGTGASPISSIRHAGIPWEIGLSETQQTLVLNSLRDQIRIQVDGQIKTGRDVVIAALLGADEFGFGTASLVSLGCVLMRKCHLNTCPVGVATQNKTLRKRFGGKPEHLTNFMRFIAREVREIMAELGFRRFSDMVGRVDCLDRKKSLRYWKLHGLDFTKVLHKVEPPEIGTIHFVKEFKESLVNEIDPILIEKSQEALASGRHVRHDFPIKNSNRTVGAALSAEISKKYGSKGLPDNTIHCKFTGSAGQSFAGFLARGITFELEGDANDYLGKGLCGGKVIIYPPEKSTFLPQNNIITGNVNLFGATSGEAYINGMAGERFAVRNSGATAIVEGVGDHGCEYMTGGVVVILGQTGINFAAGMSGGIAYILDRDQLFDNKCNLEMVDVESITSQEDKAQLFSLISKHQQYTKSEYAGYIIKNWTEMFPYFVKVIPVEYKKVLERIRIENEKEKEVTILTEEVW